MDWKEPEQYTVASKIIKSSRTHQKKAAEILQVSVRSQPQIQRGYGT
jgi:hypothetical protein